MKKKLIAKLPSDRRGFIFSCLDVARAELKNDWIWKLNNDADKYSPISLLAFETRLYEPPLPRFLIHLSFEDDKGISNLWGKIQFDFKLADYLRFSSSKWPFHWCFSESKIISPLPNTLIWDLALINNQSDEKKVEIDFWGETVVPDKCDVKAQNNVLTLTASNRSVSIMNKYSKLKEGKLHLAVSIKNRVNLQFICAASKTQDTEKRISKTSDISINKVEKKIISYYQKVPQIKTRKKDWDILFVKVMDDKRANMLEVKGLYPFQSVRLRFQGQWLWDSCFHALTWSLHDKKMATKLLINLLKVQQEGGMIPCAFNDIDRESCTPGLATWHSQPPLISWALYQICDNKQILKKVYPSLVNFHNWWFRERQIGDSGLCSWINGQESGMDNSPRFDKCPLNKDDTGLREVYKSKLICIDINSQLVLDAHYLSLISKKLGCVTESKKWKIRENGLKQKINKTLWDPQDGFYYDRFAKGNFRRVKTIASFWPLVAGIPTNTQAKQLVKHLFNLKEFWAPHPVPSVSLDETSFCMDYWRGPVWINTNFIIILGLEEYGFRKEARILAEKTIDLVSRDYLCSGYLWECYDSLTGHGEYVSAGARGPREACEHYCGWTGLAANLIFRYFLVSISKR